MKWKTKAHVMKLAATVPGGESLYKLGQRLFGRLTGDPLKRLPVQIEMAQWIRDAGSSVEGKTMVEVGTGHVPLVPIGFYLSGAGRIFTVDLHRRIDWRMTRHALRWIARSRDAVRKMYLPLLEPSELERRLARLVELCERPEEFLSSADIQYLSPADAAALPIPPQSIDLHFSVTVLEHIPEAVLKGIFREARRLTKPSGLAVHVIDPSDHFWHTDKSLSSINFLRFSNAEWDRIAGNQFAYCNRLRASDYLRLFGETSWVTQDSRATVDPVALAQMHDGFPLAQAFRAHSPTDLATTRLDVLLKPASLDVG